MAVFVVSYQYLDLPDQLQQHRASHREFLGQLLKQKVLLASGPMLNEPAALLIFEYADEAALAAILNQDPFDLAGLIEIRTIRQWDPVLGIFSDRC